LFSRDASAGGRSSLSMQETGTLFLHQS